MAALVSAPSTLAVGDRRSISDWREGPAGHSPPAAIDRIRRRLDQGLTFMLPTDDAPVVARELGRRFGVPRWQFTLSATDANRHALRYARLVTGRPKVLVFETTECHMPQSD